MTRRPGESGLDGLAINEDDMVLDEDLDAQDVVVDVPAPVRAMAHASRDVVMPVAHEVDPTMKKRIALLLISAALLVCGMVVLVAVFVW